MNEPTSSYVPPLWQRIIPLRWMLWLTRPLPCKLGRHIFDSNSWGFGGAVIDWYCPRCQKRIGFTALDDASAEAQASLSAAMDILGIFQEGAR